MFKAALLFLFAVLLSPALFAQSLQVQLTSEAVAIGSDYNYIDETGANVLVEGTWLRPEMVVVNSTPEDITVYNVTMSVSDGKGRSDVVTVSFPDTLIRPGDQIILNGLYFSFPGYKADEIAKGQLEVGGNSEDFTYYSSIFFVPIH